MVRLIYTKTSSGRKKKTKSKALTAAQAEHAKFLSRMGLSASPGRAFRRPTSLPDLNTSKVGLAELSNDIPGGTAAKRNLLTDHLWKEGAQESKETIAAIEDKARRTAPLYNKGGAMLVTSDVDLKIDGKRR